MKKVLINYGGAILFYLVIFLGIILVSNRLQNINNEGGDNFKVIINN